MGIKLLLAGWPAHQENTGILGKIFYTCNYMENPNFSIFTWKYLELFSIFVRNFIIPNIKLLNFDFIFEIFLHEQMFYGTPRCPVQIPGKLEHSTGNTWNIPGKWKSKFAGHPDWLIQTFAG